MMFEDKTGFQVFTVKLKDADKVTDQARYDSQPDVMMEKIETEGGQPLFIR